MRTEPVDDITVGKLNLFLGHDYRDTRNYPEALKHYWIARDIFKGYDTPEAHYWLRDAHNEINRIERS